MTNLRRYQAVLRAPGVAWLLATSMVGRLPGAMAGLAIVLFVSRATGSYAGAGVLAAVYVAGAALAAGLVGRAADRVGRRPVLVTTAVLDAAALVTLALVPVGDRALSLGIAVLAGAATPPVAASVRSLWPELLDGAEREGVYALDATLQEVTYIAGPALVGVITAMASPAAALAVSGLMGLVGALTMASHRAVGGRGAGHALGRRPSVHSPGMSTLLAAAMALVFGLGAVEVAVAAFAGAHHVTAQAGLLLATWSLGSMAGGLGLGARVQGPGAGRRFPFLVAGVAVGIGLLALASGVPALYVLLLVSGATIAPTLGCLYGLVGALAPEGVATEAFGWLTTGFLTGAAGGAALGGMIVQSFGPRTAFLVAAGCTGLGAAVVATRRRSLASGPSPAEEPGPMEWAGSVPGPAPLGPAPGHVAT